MFRSVEVTRRQLLQLGVAGTAVAAAGTVASRIALADDLLRGGRSVSRTTGAPRRAVPSSCALCSARCGILGFIEDGRLAKIEGNPRDPNSRGRLCARGHAGINRLYDPDRVLFPMERVGRRGEGKWVRLSWEQAYDTLSERLLRLQDEKPDWLVLQTGAEGPGLMARRFVAAFGSRAFIDEGALHNASREAANLAALGSGDEVVDIANARFILNFGGNPYESHPMYVPFVQRLVDARMAGARLITFDPRLSFTAGRSDEWIPVAPGSDGSIALAMASVVVQQGLHDRRFLSSATDLSVDELASQLAPYTPEAAEAASGVRADQLRRVATEFARVRPAVALFGGGVSHQKGAIDAQRAVLLLNALVGSLGVSGGYCPAPTIDLPEPDPVPPSTFTSAEAAQFLKEFSQGKKQAGVYITCLANPAYASPNPQAFRQALQDESRVPYLVALDTNLTETSMLADLVLPAATYLESWGMETPPPQQFVPYVSLRQPVVRARSESLSIDDILLTLGTRLKEDSARFFAFPTVESYLTAVVSKVPGLAQAGALPLLREQGVWYDPTAVPERLPAAGFATSSSKVELARALAAQASESRPSPTPSARSEDTGDLTLITYRPNVHAGEYSANCWWLAEIAHSNALLINPVAAQRRGIQQGQKVKVVSSVGSVEARVRTTQGIHPQVVALAAGFGHSAVGRIARAESFKSDDPMTLQVWWKKQGNGVNANALIPVQIGETGSGLVWMDTSVRIET